MRVGFVVECHRDGADHKVIERIVSRLHGSLELRWVFAGSKGALFRECGDLVKGLIENDRCDRVFVVWDLMPCDEDMQDAGRPSCEKERAHLLLKIDAKFHGRTVLICIRHELEAWLLCDGRALTAFLKNDNHPKPAIRDDKHPDRYKNPKVVLQQIFEVHQREYRDAEHAPKLIARVSNLSKLERVQSFKRLCDKLAGFVRAG